LDVDLLKDVLPKTGKQAQVSIVLKNRHRSALY
jgi:hypothetical protein